MTSNGPPTNEGASGLSEEMRRRLESLSPAQRALLERTLRARASQSVAVVDPNVIVRRSSNDAPLSFNQELLWRLDQAVPDLVAYNVPRVLRLDGPLDVAALRRAIDALGARHEAFRTRFEDSADGPRQVVDAPSSLPFDVIELDGADDATLDRTLRGLTRRRFDLARDAQLRATLVRVAPDAHVLHLLSHHIVTDEGSREVLFRELAALYAAERRGETVALPPLTIQFADYAAWERGAIDRGPLAEQMAYWRERLRGVATLDLPIDRPRPTVPSFVGERRRRTLPRPLLDGLKQIARANDASLFMVLVASFDVLLARYAGQEDIAIGTPVSARSRPELEHVIGFFANTLVLRTDASGDPTFVELLARVRGTCLDAYERPDVPYERLSLEMRAGAARGGRSLTDVALVVDTPNASKLELDGLRVERLASDHGSSKFDLTLGFTEVEDGLRATAEFRTDLFDGTTIDRLLGSLETIARAIVADPTAHIASLPVIGEAERELMLVDWNRAATPDAEPTTLLDVLAAQPALTPDAIAIESVDSHEVRTTLTYHELHARANQLAWALQSFGVGPDVPVALFAERSPEFVIAMLGVLKAGGAYLPLDPEYPADRIAFMLEDAAPRVVLTLARHRALLPETSLPVIVLDEAWSDIEAHPRDRAPSVEITPEHLAYILYTSGSTGRPKGVMLPHRAIAHFTRAARAIVPFGVDDTVFQKTPVTFDPSGLETYVALSSGARLFLARPDRQQDLTYVLETMAAERVNFMIFIPSALAASVDLPEFDAACAHLRLIICGGEALSVDLASRALGASPEAILVNMYGPTEATIAATTWQVRGDERAGDMLPIGMPMDGTRAYVLDQRLQPVPIGVAGELCLGGPQIARGYLNRPELTADRFVVDAFSDDPRARLYRTGDMARWRADGAIEFLGRVDSQVKLRGFRIELGEIEAVLVREPRIVAATAIVREDTPGDQRLVAYYVVDAGEAPDVQELNAALRSALPPFMMPSALVALDTLPLTSNGKVDRDRLPAPSGPSSKRETVAPRTPAETTIAAIWADVLRVDVGAEDGFLELGGHSLLAMRIIGRVRHELGASIALGELLRGATVAEIAARIDADALVTTPAIDDEPALMAVDRGAYRRQTGAGA